MAFLNSFIYKKDDPDGTNGKISRIAGDLNVEGRIYAESMELTANKLLHYVGPNTLKYRLIKFAGTEGSGWITQSYIRIHETDSNGTPIDDALNPPVAYPNNHIIIDMIAPDTIKNIQAISNINTELYQAESIQARDLNITNIDITTSEFVPLYKIEENLLIDGDLYYKKATLREDVFYCTRNTKSRVHDIDMYYYKDLLTTYVKK